MTSSSSTTLHMMRSILWIGLVLGVTFVAVQHSTSSMASIFHGHDNAMSSSNSILMNDNDNSRRRLWRFQFFKQKKTSFHTMHERNAPFTRHESSSSDSATAASKTTNNNIPKLPTVQEVKKRLQNESFRRRDLLWNDNHTIALPHQFLHLHHMKTGGTSTDSLLRCAQQRITRTRTQSNIPYQNLHECSHSRYERCISGEDSYCVDRSNSSAIMSYCAPLSDLKYLGWKDGEEEEDVEVVAPSVDKMTVLRHPVDRVWSMYRFQTKGCYRCRPLLDIYKQIDDPEEYNKTDDSPPIDDMCKNQLLNHQVRNLRTNSKETSDNMDRDAVEEAIHNLYTSFTMIGLTKELPTTALMMGKIWPWLATEFNGEECRLPHANASPKNNHCADGGSHMDLGDEPDEETRRVIEEHNKLDIELYEAAVPYFDVLKKALDINENEEDYDEKMEKEEEEPFDLEQVRGAINEARQKEANSGGDEVRPKETNSGDRKKESNSGD